MAYVHQVVDPKRLKGNPWNPNILDAASEAKLDASILRLGVFKPIIVRELEGGVLEILGGHHRWGSCLRQKHEEVPIVNLGVVDDATAKEIGLADNGRWGHDDAGKLAEMFSGLDMEALTDFLPYSSDDLSAIIATADVDLSDLNLDDDDDIPLANDTRAPPTETIIRFKVPVRDAETISSIIKRTAATQGFDGSNELTNAGDALVFLLVTEKE